VVSDATRWQQKQLFDGSFGIGSILRSSLSRNILKRLKEPASELKH
jgi:hypothetical protein